MSARAVSFARIIRDLKTSFRFRRRLLLKIVVISTIVLCGTLLSNTAFDLYFSYQDRKKSLIRIQQEQAEAAAGTISQFVRDIEDQIAWSTHPPWTTAASDRERLDLWRTLLHQTPAITQLSLIDASGREQLRVSRFDRDLIGSGTDFSSDPKFREAMTKGVYHGEVYFRRESEPYMTIALAGPRNASVSVAEVNLKFIWDVVSQIKVGQHGHAYVVDGHGRLIAHPDISLVLRNLDMTHLSQVKSARMNSPGSTQVADDVYGRKVLTAYAPIMSLDWLTFVELPIDEAYAPLDTLILRISIVFLIGLLVALIVDVFLAQMIVRPLERLEAFVSAVRETKDYALRINYTSDDEIGRLAAAFNGMLAELAAARAQDRRLQAERLTSLGRLTAGIAHEINSPVGTSLTIASILAERCSAFSLEQTAGQLRRSQLTAFVEGNRDAANQLVVNLQRAAKLVQSFRQIAVDNADENRCLFDLNHTTNQVLAVLQHTVKGLDVVVEIDVPDGITMNSYPGAYGETLAKLFANAVTHGFGDRRSGRITIKARQLNKHQAEIIFSDDGRGMTEPVKRHAFDPFFTTDRNLGGTGLGLHIVYNIVTQRLGGQISLKSGSGHGATFIMLIPMLSPT